MIPDIFICSLAVADLVHIIGMPFLIYQWARGGQWVFGGASLQDHHIPATSLPVVPS